MFRRNKSRALFLVFLCGLSSACTDSSKLKENPEKTLSDYVSRSFAVKSVDEKAKLVELTTGEVKAALEKLDADEFKTTFIDAKKEFIALKIRDERKVGEGRFSITYEITYINKSSDSQDKITNKKHALFLQENGKWLVSEVRNLKTFIEHQNEMSF